VAYEKPCCGISCVHLPSLLDLFRGLTDTRKGQGKRHRLATLCTIIACAKLSGIPGGYRVIYLYARSLTKPQRRALHCWINPRSLPWQPRLKPCFRRAFPPQVVTLEDNRIRRQRRAIATRTAP
jgi:hypothetical protein